MEIRIDTNKDSHEDIRKVIRFLKMIVGDHSEDSSSGSGSSPSPVFDVGDEAAGALAGIFGSDSDESPRDSDPDLKPKRMSDDSITVIPY
ncbi:hypothetical protein JW826_05965 [Candidatus Woesearchaeota archaeon]|nr:hypothetical protein [Candidatus Woesearchaeota archaeon]